MISLKNWSPIESLLETEERCARILERRGWSVRRTPLSHDGGVDVIGSRIDEVGIEETIYIQCKDYARPVGISVVRELIGSLPAGANIRAVLTAPSGVIAEAGQLAQQRGVIIWDQAKLGEL